MTKKKKTTMSVPEMQRLLGLGKTDAYWLVKKQCFETVVVAGKMRVVIDSFEHWYANQVKHSKVHGPPPGKELRAKSYSSAGACGRARHRCQYHIRYYSTLQY